MRTLTKLMMAAALLLAAAAQAQTTTTHKKTDTVETASGQRTGVAADSTAERKFMEKAASGGMAEVQLGKLAVDKASSPTVKQFGQRMVDDHSKANDELKEIAAKKNMPLPTEIDSQHKATYDKLSKLSGPEFDKAYMDAMVKDHDEDVKEFKRASNMSGADADVKSWAKKTLDVIEQHDHLAHQDKTTVKKEK